jgi:hypothetical protein
MRLPAIALVLLAACGGSSRKGAEPPVETPEYPPGPEEASEVASEPAATCDDIAAHAAELGADADAAENAGKLCADAAWSEPMRSCVVAADLAGMPECLRAEADRSGFCAAIEQLVAAAHEDPPFASAYGEEYAEEMFDSKLGLPTATCAIDDYEQELFCRVIKGVDVNRAHELESYLQVSALACLGEDEWKYERWLNSLTHRDGTKVSTSADGAEDYSYTVYVVVGR